MSRKKDFNETGSPRGREAFEVPVLTPSRPRKVDARRDEEETLPPNGSYLSKE